ncbi:hypothetical protein EVAR_82671_1 [Eumeta japonica]|uniref:Uncharacterized protein n=1 Tax=Eumeta variegata TaxID=151549 RepID=A0A4C1VBT8_EUMVA|nr:hypothetical protein EVAR_82671_1 [Eumeta japonica]
MERNRVGEEGKGSGLTKHSLTGRNAKAEVAASHPYSLRLWYFTSRVSPSLCWSQVGYSVALPQWLHHSGSTTVAPSQWLIYSGSTTVAPPRWLHDSGSTTVAPPQWLHHSGSTTVGHPYIVFSSATLPTWISVCYKDHVTHIIAIHRSTPPQSPSIHWHIPCIPFFQ